MTGITWTRFPRVGADVDARAWLTFQEKLGLAPNTLLAYGRGLEDFFAFSARAGVAPAAAARDHIAAFVHDLRTRAAPGGRKGGAVGCGGGLANATMQQKLTAVRLFYDYLMEEGRRATNPVGRGRYTPGRAFGGKRERGLIPRFHRLPWVPTDDQWRAILRAAREEPLRNRFMLALSYDAGLRREELCALRTGDIDPAHRLLRVRAEVTKNRQERVVPYSEATGVLFGAYLRHRRTLDRTADALFLSESRRNRAQPLSVWAWNKAVAGIAARAAVPGFTPHTLRHLCLTDLARAGWDLHEIARFAGHRSLQSTLRYIHLSGRDLAAKLAAGMAQIHAWRAAVTGEVLA
jgi:site-specific recombinase XerD